MAKALDYDAGVRATTQEYDEPFEGAEAIGTKVMRGWGGVAVEDSYRCQVH